MTNATRDARRGRTILSAIAVGLLGAALVSGPALAGKPSGGGTSGSGLSAPVLVTDAAANGSVNHLDTVTFQVTSGSAQPFVGVRCYQGSSFVYDSYVGYYDAAWFAKSFLLDSTYWAAGASASCTARLFSYDSRGRERVQATRTFSVAP